MTKTCNTTILLKIKDETFVLESIENLNTEILSEIEILCHSANDADSEFNTIRKEKGFDEELYEMSPYDIAEIFQKVVFQNLNIRVDFIPINLEVKIWL